MEKQENSFDSESSDTTDVDEVTLITTVAVNQHPHCHVALAGRRDR